MPRFSMHFGSHFKSVMRETLALGTMTHRLTAAHLQDTRPQEPIQCEPATRKHQHNLRGSARLCCFQTSSLQLHKQFTAERMPAQFHRTSPVPALKYQCRMEMISALPLQKKKKYFFFWVFPQLFNRGSIVSFCQPAALVFVFIHNRLPDSRHRGKKRKHRPLCLEMQYLNMIKLG